MALSSVDKYEMLEEAATGTMFRIGKYDDFIIKADNGKMMDFSDGTFSEINFDYCELDISEVRCGTSIKYTRP